MLDSAPSRALPDFPYRSLSVVSDLIKRTEFPVMLSQASLSLVYNTLCGILLLNGLSSSVSGSIVSTNRVL